MTERGKPTRVAIVGFGTVGRAVARLLQELAPPELRLTVIVNRGIERKRVDWIDRRSAGPNRLTPRSASMSMWSSS
jgi:glyceraldehyde-3-phosphate dehydrogenase/erythrose-4-phosphate dehydrogenase